MSRSVSTDDWAPAARGDARRPEFPTAAVILAALLLLVARLLAGHFSWFFQNDEVSLAAGVAAVEKGSIGYVYRYAPQAGYYQLVRGLDVLFGGGLRLVPPIMIWLSSIAGTVIPLCGLYFSRDVLTRAERLVLAGVLAVNPIIWMSSAYGNSAMPSVALLVIGLTLLSNRPGPRTEIAALVMLGAAIFVRADAVLALGGAALLLYQRYGTVQSVLRRFVPLVAGLAALYGTLHFTDPYMRGGVNDVAEHLTGPYLTRFWDYLLWSTSPVLLAGAVLGGRELLDRRRGLLLVIVAWCLPFFAFYYSSTTNPRYFIPTAFPIAVASAVGLVALVDRLGRRWWAWWTTGALACVHLFVGLSHFAPNAPRSVLTRAEFETHIGPFWTGAFLYKSYLDPSFLYRSIRHPGFGRASRSQSWLDSSLAAVAAGRDQGRTIVVLPTGWNAHVFHYYAHVHGALYVSRTPGTYDRGETWMTLGGARIGWIAPKSVIDREFSSALQLRAGDAIWISRGAPGVADELPRHLPAGLVMRLAADTSEVAMHHYRLERLVP